MRPLYIGAIFKNEAMGIAEWLAHYRRFGVDHFFLINDASTDAYESEIEPFRDVITLYQNDIPANDGRQKTAYNKFFAHLRNEDVWLMIVDLDEFIYPPHDQSIKDVLNRYDDYSQITVDWILFGSNGHIRQPQSIRLSFTRCHDNLAPLSYKSIVKPRDILVEYDIHRSNVRGKSLHFKLITREYDAELVCNHYQVQSLERWQNVCMTRGCVNFPQHHGIEWRNMERFHQFDFNDKEDRRLARILTCPVTIVVTSYNRPHLLRKTLESFVKHNTYPNVKCIIIEDSGNQNINDFAPSICPFPVTCIYNESNIGQVASIEKVYSMIDTPYIFHCEEDWEFYSPGFIEKSFDVLEKDPSVITVWLRAHSDVNGHPIESKDQGGYRYMESDTSRHPYYGFTFNPGLRRTSDYQCVAPWKETCSRPHFDDKEWLFEPDIAILYKSRGYRAAILTNPHGFVRHIGWTESTNPIQHANAGPKLTPPVSRIPFRIPIRRVR